MKNRTFIPATYAVTNALLLSALLDPTLSISAVSSFVGVVQDACENYIETFIHSSVPYIFLFCFSLLFQSLTVLFTFNSFIKQRMKFNHYMN